jgi:DNA-binding MarR family transcriptional regulator
MDDPSTIPEYVFLVTTVRWLNERELRAWRALQTMDLLLTAELARRLAAESGLSYQDYLVLVVLTEQPDRHLRAFELGDLLGWEKSRLSHHIKRMADRGLVKKVPCDEDRRGAFVTLTAKGRKAIVAAAPGHVAAVRRLFVDRVTPEQLDVIADAAEAVVAGLGDE